MKLLHEDGVSLLVIFLDKKEIEWNMCMIFVR